MMKKVIIILAIFLADRVTKFYLLNLQAEGKNPMTIKQFLQGNKINENFLIS